MTPEVQTLLSLLAVGLATVWLIRRAFRKKTTGCAGECGCPSVAGKSKLAKLARR